MSYDQSRRRIVFWARLIEHIKTILEGVDQHKVPKRGGRGVTGYMATKKKKDTWSVILIDEYAGVYGYFIQPFCSCTE